MRADLNPGMKPARNYTKLFQPGWSEWGPPHRGAPREPLRTVTELAAEFGVHPTTLWRYLRRTDAPAPVFGRNRPRQKWAKSYFVPSEVRKWWREVYSRGDES
jgi:hypothetical protein